MAEFVTAIFNNTGTLLAILVFYLLSLWLMFCLWIFVDSMHRYHNMLVSILFTILVFVFNFPALIFYLIIRPEDESASASRGSGVSVPIVDFIGQNGEVQMSINLQLGAQLSANPDMAVDVDWGNGAANKSISVNPKMEGASEKKASALTQRLSFFRSKAGDSLKQVVDNSKKKVEEYSQDLNEEVTVETPTTSKVSSKKNK